jgi:multimeric flavodoxin WrbA
VKVLGISGSPRKGGNTETLLRQALLGAEDAGASTSLLILSGMNIHPCRACDGCLQTGECVVNDDMQVIYREIESLGGLILASPVYFYGLTAQAKAMIDRFQAFWNRRSHLNRRMDASNRRGLFLSVGGTTFPDLFDHARATVEIFFRTIDVTYWDELLIAGVDEREGILKHPGVLDQAYDLGKRLVQRGNEDTR